MHWIDNEIISCWDSFCMSRRHFYHNKSQVITVLWVSISNNLATTSEITWIFLRRASNLSLLFSDVCSHGEFSHPESRIIKNEVNVAAPRFFSIIIPSHFFFFFRRFIPCNQSIYRMQQAHRSFTLLQKWNFYNHNRNEEKNEQKKIDDQTQFSNFLRIPYVL